MSIQTHIARVDNPHRVTKEQLDLGNVENFSLASRQEVIDLARTDRYIDFENIDWVNEAFIQYMKDIGVMDENGDYNLLPNDTSGSNVFYRDENEINFLYGTHPTAYAVNVSITLNDTVIGEYDNIPLNSTNWVADISALALTDNTPYVAEITYLTNQGASEGKTTVTMSSVELDVNFTINSLTHKGFISGATTGYTSLDVVIKQGTSVIKPKVVINTALGGWTIDLSALSFNPMLPYVAEVETFINGVYIKTRLFNSVVSDIDPGTLYYVDPVDGADIYDFRRFEHLSDVGLYYVDSGVLV